MSDTPDGSPSVELADARASLQASEENFRLLVESVRDYAIFLLDTRGNVASWNAGAARIKGYAGDEIIGRHFSAFYLAEEIASGKCEMELRVAAEVGRFEDEGWRKRKDGTTFWANVVITALRNPGGRLVGYAKVTRDLTDRKRAEDERIQLEAGRKALEAERTAREAADAANRAKDDFLAHVSHELRTPLNAILGWSRLLRTPMAEERRTRAIATVERNAEAMAHLIEDLLDVSRIVSGKMRLDVGPVDLALVVEGALDATRLSAEAKNIRIDSTVDPAVPPMTGDATRLQQVAWNLISNAVKFTPRGGHIAVAVRRRQATAEIVVEDTGVGLAPDLVDHVFSPFWQGATAGSGSTRGLGLGLAIVRSIAELHGGSARAESDGVGRGARFIIAFPLNSKTRPLDVDAPEGKRFSAHPTLVGLRVVVVEDDDDARELVATLLEGAGMKVTTAANVADALASIDAQLPDLLVSDIGLPGASGHDLVRDIRARRPEDGGRIPAVALTAYAQAEDRQRALGAGFDLHVPKPIEPSELLAALAILAASRVNRER